MPIPFPISPSMLSKYDTCPKQFEAQYVTREVTFTESVHTRFGNVVHGNIEHYLLGQQELSPYLSKMRPILDKLKQNQTMVPERHFGIDRAFKTSPYKDKVRTWLRCKADVAVHDTRMGLIIDWKTGKQKSDWIQEEVNAICFKSLLGLDEVYTAFSHIVKGGTIIKRHDFKEKPVKLIGLIMALENAWDTGVYEAKPNGLCKEWCEVFSCPNNGRSK